MITNCKSGLRRLSSPIALIALAAAFLAAAEPVKTPENDRLIQAARLWTTVKYFHPYLASRAIDWDKALIDALPRIRAAQSNDEYAAALQSLLDPVHGVILRATEGSASAASDAPAERTWIHHGFPPESGRNTGTFYSAFLVQPPGTSLAATIIPLDGGLRAQINLFDHETAGVPLARSDSYPASPFPSTEYRILAAFKTWGVIHYFFAYRDLMDEDWDEVFASFLPRFIAAKDAREYHLAVAEMLTHTLDSHVTVTSDELSGYFGRATAGLSLRLIEKRPVITEVLDENAKAAGLRPGDIVSKVDGESIAVRFNRIQDYVSGSTAQRRGYDSLERVLNGPEGSTATLLVLSPEGTAREVKIERRPIQEPAPRENAIRTLPGGIGYVDLTHLSDDRLPAIFEKFQNTRAIIFDARGPVSPAALAIASHLTDANDVAGAIVTGPVTLSPDIVTTNTLTSTASYFFIEKIPPVAPKYQGKTVMLIDERTIGAAEHLGLWMEAANNTAFIGTPSAGADGETSNFILPGGITVTFSGQDVRHGNSGKLQRLGLQPNVLVAPTVTGIRHGRDEVLEKAIEYLSPPRRSQML